MTESEVRQILPAPYKEIYESVRYPQVDITGYGLDMDREYIHVCMFYCARLEEKADDMYRIIKEHERYCNNKLT